MRYIRFKKEKQQINFLNCAKPNKWIDTCQYRESDFEDVCDGECDCDTIVSPNIEGILVYEWSGDTSSIQLNDIRYDVTKNPYWTTLKKLGIDELTSCRSTFSDSNITKLRCFLDTSNVTDMYAMFSDCRGLTSLDLSNFNTSNVISMISMFSHCTSLTTLDLSGWDTSNVTNMNGMFYFCENLTSLDLSSFDTSKVTAMTNMFYACQSLTSLDLSGWDTSNVTEMSFMFGGWSNLRTIYMRGCNETTINMIENALTYGSIRDNVTIIT